MAIRIEQLWRDERGFVLSTELVLISTIVVIGMVSGLTCLQQAVVGELKDVGQAIGSLNQSYCYTGFCAQKQCCLWSYTSGSAFVDLQDSGERSLQLRSSIHGGVVTPQRETGPEQIGRASCRERV